MENAPAAESIEGYRARVLEAGANEVIERRWSPGQVVETHTHPFDADALMAAGVARRKPAVGR